MSLLWYIDLLSIRINVRRLLSCEN